MAGGQEVARLVVSVGADLSGLERGLGEAKAQTETFGGGMGKAATQVRQVETAAVSAAAGVRQVGQAHQEAHGHVQRFNLETATTAELMVGSRRTFMQLAESLVGLGAGAVAVGVAFGAFEKIKGALETTTEFGHRTLVLQSIMGGSSEEASKLLATFDRFGLSAEQSGVMLGIFSRHLQGVDDPLDGVGIGAKSSAEALAQLGVKATDANGNLRPTSDIILDVADGFSHMKDGAEKTSIAMALFGRSGREIIFPLNQGRAGLQEAMEAAEKYGLVLSGENVKQIHEFMMAQKDLNQASTGLSLAMGETLVPALTTLETALANALSGTRQLTLAQIALAAIPGAKGAIETVSAAITPPPSYANGLTTPAEFAGGRFLSMADRLAASRAQAETDLYQYALQSNAQAAMEAMSPGGIGSYGASGQLPGLVTGAREPTPIYPGHVPSTADRADDFRRGRAWEAEQYRVMGITDDDRHGRQRYIEKAGDAQAVALARSLGPLAEMQRAQGIEGIEHQIEAFRDTQQQTELGRQMRGLQAASALDTAFGNSDLGRSEELKAAKLQDHLRYLQEISANQSALASAEQQRDAARLAYATAEHDQDAAAMKAADEKVTAWGAYVDQIRAARGAIEETTDAQNALNVKTLEMQFSRGQAAARAGLSDDALAWRIGTLGHPETGRLQAAKDQKELEDQLFGVFQERRSAELDLQRARRDGDEAGATAIERRIALLDREAAKVKELAGGKARGSPSWWKSLSKEEQQWRIRMGDVYGQYGSPFGDGGTALDPNAAEKKAKEAASGEVTHLHGDVNITVQNATSDEVLGALEDSLKKRLRRPVVLAPA